MRVWKVCFAKLRDKKLDGRFVFWWECVPEFSTPYFFILYYLFILKKAVFFMGENENEYRLLGSLYVFLGLWFLLYFTNSNSVSFSLFGYYG